LKDPKHMLNNDLHEIQRVQPNIEEAQKFLANALVNQLTKTNLYSFYLVYSGLVLYFSYTALQGLSPLTFIASFLAGLLIWTLAEYLTHRFPFHFKSTQPFFKLTTFMFHGIHHAYPRDLSRSITPIHFGLPLTAIFYFIFTLFSGIYLQGMFAGFVFGYILYAVIHDATHHFAMDYPLLKALKKNHLRHHYFDSNKNFGVTSPLWDLIFKTYVKNSAVNSTVNSAVKSMHTLTQNKA
jgi:sterol desaturase/sphingolipid hydroxylase (fatty acid hydroxylase superfamily)